MNFPAKVTAMRVPLLTLYVISAISSISSISAISVLGQSRLAAAEASWDNIHAILEARCTSCHGDTKQKAGLRLDSPEWLAKGSHDGAVVVAGQPAVSKIYTMAALPEDHEDRMPPKGERLTAEQLTLLKQWIAEGAKTATAEKKPEPVAALPKKIDPAKPESAPSDMMQSTMEDTAHTGSRAPAQPRPPAAPEAPIIPAPAAPEFAITALTTQSFVINTLPGGWRDVHAGHAKNGLSDTHLPLLNKIGPAVAFLDLANSGITDRQFKLLTTFSNVQRLHLEHTPVSDAGLTALAAFPQLTYLNLFATDISDAGLAALPSLKQLDELYVWQSKITPAGIAALKKKLPDLEIFNGPEDLPTVKIEEKKKKRK
jgi:mono/diheme cytochrome c family protein